MSSVQTMSGDPAFAALKDDIGGLGLSAKDISALDLEGTSPASGMQGAGGPGAGMMGNMDRRVQQMIENMDLTAEGFSLLAEAGYQPATAADTANEMQGSAGPEVTAMPPGLAELIASREAMESKTLDTTTYVDKMIGVAGSKQGMTAGDNGDLAKKIDELVKALSGKIPLDMKDKINITLKVGDRDFNAQVMEALSVPG